MIINEMIREYLEYNKYYNSSSVLITETGQPHEPPFDRDFLQKKFGISSSSKANKESGMPLLYELIFGLKPETNNSD
jgi:lisH domain-containing protein FOPNL